MEEPIELIRRFVASPRAAEIAAATEVYAELEFLLAWPPDAVGAAVILPHPVNRGGSATATPTTAPEGRYLQGFIDCLYRDAASQWRLIDYKTNRVRADTLASTSMGYEMQMLVYALAVERILHSPPAELVLCFLRPGLEYHFSWDAAARQRVLELVNGALA